MDRTLTTNIAFTENQKKAITTMGRNLCVTAGAGSGKTTVLVERYLHLIEKGEMDTREIVAITFTEKAANQMKEKIRDKIKERINNIKTGTEREEWERRYREIGSAWIHTIHSFCTRLLKENPVDAGVDPHFTTLDETETVMLIHKVIAAFINDRLNRDAEPMVQFLTAFGLGAAREMLTELLQKRDAVHPCAREYLEKTDAEILSHLQERGAAGVKGLTHELGKLTCPDPTDKLEEIRLAVLDYLSSPVLTKESLEPVSTTIDLRKGSKKKWGEEELGQVKETLGELRDLAKNLLPLYDEERVQTELGLLRSLLQEFEILRDRYSEEKSSQGLLDFDDLLILARDLLKKNPHVRDNYRSRIKTLLIDELQDTDPLQMEIVEQFCGGGPGRIFAVGDAKQSIYSFRGADVSEFQRFEQKVREEDEKGVISLNRNFRSQKQILVFINTLFSRIFPAQPQTEDDICFDKLEFHKGSVRQEHFVEGLFIPTKRGEKSAEEARLEEAAWIASRIRTMVENREERVLADDGQTRAVEYGDMAILFRAMTDVKIYGKELRNLGIPFTVISGAGFFEKQEVADILNMLKVLLYPDDEEALMGILRSPVIGVRDDTLFFMTRGRSLSQGLQEAEQIQGIDETEREILIRARQMIEKLRRARDRVRTPELIARFLDETSYPALLLTDPMHGHQRYANLKKLTDLAWDFSSRPFFGLADFIEYIDELRERAAREGESTIDEETQNTVRIMTIHKAKGLEFPVVFLPDLGRKSSGRSDTIAIHSDLGIGIKVPDGKGGLEKSFIRSIILEEKKASEINEEKRLFYVACTRAKDFLVLSGQIGFSKNSKKDSAVPMDWLKEALEITEENYAGDIPYGEKSIKTASQIGSMPPPLSKTERWVDKYPDILQGQPVKVDGNESAQSLIKRATSAPSPAPPARFTVSQLLLYRKCPRGYELSGLRGISEPERDDQPTTIAYGGRELGNLVHGILQRWDFDVSTIEASAERELNRSGLSRQEKKSIREQALKLIRDFSETETAEEIRSSTEIYTEVPILINLDKFHIEGVIDKLYRNKSGQLTIIDYKTDKVTQTDVPLKAEEYRFQLATYALAAHLLFGEAVKTALVFLQPGITHPIQTDPAKTESEIRSTVQKIQTTASFPFNQDHCSKCGYWGPFCSQNI